MELILTSKSKRSKVKVERDHSWYDTESKKMLNFRGGRLEFDYDPKTKKAIPKVVDHEEYINGTDYPEIKKWLKTNAAKHGITILEDNGRNVTISIDNSDFDDVREDLYRHRIISDY